MAGKQKPSPHSKTQSILARLSDLTIQLTITIHTEDVKKAYDESLTKIIQETTLPGFRKGKAPRELVEQKTEKTKIYEEVIQTIVSRSYFKAVKEHNLKPIISPKIELLKAEEGKDWEIRATTCEAPKINLGNYKEEIRKVLAPSKIWVPGKSEKGKGEKAKEESEEEKNQKIIQILLQLVPVDLPRMLIEDEVNRALSGLINQTNSLGLTVEQYMASIGKNKEIIRQEYQARAESDLKLQFILEQIAEDEKIEISEKEIDSLIEAIGDQKLNNSLNNPAQRAHLGGILRRRKALELLVKL